MVQDRLPERIPQTGIFRQMLVNCAFKPDALIVTEQAASVKVAVIPHSFRTVIADGQISRTIPVPVLRIFQKFHQFCDVLIQPFIGIQPHEPHTRAPVKYRVARRREVINPREIEKNIRVLGGDITAAILRTGVRHHQLTWQGFPKRLQRFDAPFQTAYFIFENDANR